ncbi:hypothetical protein [Myceligenerans pegani]|uniref:Uncharacterized protein n=1 Tax=Myceligenerans pegani TaxID=2776917 RepID=A0ABR9MSY6_9MICO|nr:hypothetical protein [Myceligenerans sp. TRM 65318]MBE1874489.1 hypothetical protein [Myceligenerans sp. TRM 65318]MBE3016760.1 hypothetical protein [Myceligenerans sp. TRM 65318]
MAFPGPRCGLFGPPDDAGRRAAEVPEPRAVAGLAAADLDDADWCGADDAPVPDAADFSGVPDPDAVGLRDAPGFGGAGCRPDGVAPESSDDCGRAAGRRRPGPDGDAGRREDDTS